MASRAGFRKGEVMVEYHFWLLGSPDTLSNILIRGVIQQGDI